MLDPWIIEEIKRREEQRGHRAGCPALEMPIAPPDEDEPDAKPEDEGGERGVAIVDFTV